MGVSAPVTSLGDRCWLMQDSMADRVGGEGEHGYCLPEVCTHVISSFFMMISHSLMQVHACGELASALSAEGEESLRAVFAAHQEKEQLPHNVQRLLRDAYIAVYADEARAPLA